MIRLYRYGSRHTFLTLFGIFAAFNLLSYMYYVSPRLPAGHSSSLDRFSEQSQRRMEKLADQLNEPSFLVNNPETNGVIMSEQEEEEDEEEAVPITKENISEIISNDDIEMEQEIIQEEQAAVSAAAAAEAIEAEESSQGEEAKSIDGQGVSAKTTQLATQLQFLHNPWFSTNSDESDPLGTDPGAYQIQTVDNCQFRDFTNHSYFGVPEFATEYIKYKECVRRHDSQTQSNQWLGQRLVATVGEKGELVIDTSRMVYDIDEVDFCTISDPKILFIVKTNAKDQEKRKIVRETWGSTMISRSGSNRVLFLTGRDRVEIEDQHNHYLLKESEKYADIIQTCVEEGEIGFGAKQLLSALMWLQERCPMARFVVITDDSTFININRFDLLVEKEMYAANRIYGSLMRRMQPNRDPNSVHFISQKDWPWNFYPPFVREPTFIISSDLVPRLLLAASTLDLIPLEQVYLTGVVSLLARAMRIDVSNFFGLDAPAETSEMFQLLQTSRQPLEQSEACLFANKGAFHGVTSRDTMTQLESIFESVNRQNVTCNEAPQCLAMVEGKCLFFAKDQNEKKRKRQKDSLKRRSK